MKNKKISGGSLALIIIGAVLLITALWIGGTYNSLVGSQEKVNEKWANIQADYQRRADLIPNLVSTVKAYTNYEGNLLNEITQARSMWTNARTQEDQFKAANSMDSALGRLIAVAENYPNLKANENYLSLQDELAGTENRIKYSRTEFNNAVRTYNVKIRSFPTNIIAGMFSFEQNKMFEATSGSETAPNVGTLLK